jgi:hypothetical protein
MWVEESLGKEYERLSTNVSECGPNKFFMIAAGLRTLMTTMTLR